MSYNGSGVYTLPGAQLANGEVVSATENNQFRNDVAAALNIAWTRDGQAPATANIPMGSHKFTGLAAGTGVGDSVCYEQLPSASNLLPVASGGTGSGTASGARTNLGVVIGTDVQAYAAELQGATQGGFNGMKNRIINGAMMIDQRNAGASVTPTSGQYFVDRWLTYVSQASKLTAQQNAGTVTPPVGFANYLGFTSSSAYSITSSDYFMLLQKIEGFNISDLAWGTANAKAVTLSFQVYSSLTGTFGGAIRNPAATASYPFSYSVSAVNTWTTVVVTIPGATIGAWGTGNSAGLEIDFGLGVGSTYSGTAGSWAAADYRSATGATSVVGTNGATFYITGVQLEKGSTATSFDYRPYGTELALCQRYYAKLNSTNGNYVCFGAGAGVSGAAAIVYTKYPVAMRSSPTLSQSNTAIYDGINNTAVTSIGTVYYGDNTLGATLNCSTTAAGRGVIWLGSNNPAAYFDLTAEL